MKKRRFVQAVMFSGVLSASAFALAPPAFASGKWFPQPCSGVGTVCTSGALDANGQLITSTDGTLKWNACDSVTYKSSSFDGIIWQNGPGGKTTCTVVRGSNG